MRLSTIAIVLGLLGVPYAAHADPVQECSAKSASQVEVGACMKRALQDVSNALKATLESATDSAKSLDSETGREEAVPALKASQAAWRKYRKTQCAFAGSMYGSGSGSGIAILSCEVELTRARIDDLAAVIN